MVGVRCCSVKLISRVNRKHAETKCIDEVSGRRIRRADDVVYLNKTLLTDAIRHSLNDLQQVVIAVQHHLHKGRVHDEK